MYEGGPSDKLSCLTNNDVTDEGFENKGQMGTWISCPSDPRSRSILILNTFIGQRPGSNANIDLNDSFSTQYIM